MDPKSAARERFESSRDLLIELSHRIHAHPELGFEEEQSSSWLCEADLNFRPATHSDKAVLCTRVSHLSQKGRLNAVS